MDLISAIRSQQPAPQTASPAATERAIGTPAAASAKPVAETLRRDALQPPSGLVAQVSVQLAERDEGRHPVAEARAAAEAARDAYIRASIAAGINPLPLP